MSTAKRWKRVLIPVVVVAAVASVGLAWHRRGQAPEPAFRDAPRVSPARVKNPHDHEGKPACPVCHDGPRRRLRAEPSKLCQRCHAFADGKHHPVGVKQTDPAAPGLPLLGGGRLACHTCHDPHGATAGLRIEFNDLCGACHLDH